MNSKIAVLLLVPALPLVSGCSSSSNGNAERDPEALAERIGQVFVDEGVTPFDALPTGSATYSGLIGAERDDPDFDNDMGFLADLELSVTFDDQSVSGQISNFTTDVPGFENPTGTAAITGVVENDSGNAGISFSASGTLTSDTASAELDMFDATGDFGGNNGRVVAGEQFSDIDWLTGPNAGDTFFSDGNFGAERN